MGATHYALIVYNIYSSWVASIELVRLHEASLILLKMCGGCHRMKSLWIASIYVKTTQYPKFVHVKLPYIICMIFIQPCNRN